MLLWKQKIKFAVIKKNEVKHIKVLLSDVIATHGIVKKTQRTPIKEIRKAEEIRKEYFNDKAK